ncbi:nickel ABC transporter permease [Dactylosporangium sp. NPDC050688]|uniref:nickel ABC transporter permease n=1 Tax=Dactylosporangium sp. NPDC050688 TaxID=3157217 RepID=UPI0033DC181E
MIRVILTRILATVPVLLGIAVVAFFLVRLIPGDTVNVLMGQDFSDPVLEAEMRAFFGLDQPLPVQFWDWFSALLQGDLGHSMRSGEPVTQEILRRFPITVELAIAALLISLTVSIPVGIYTARNRNKGADAAARVASLIGLSLPNFWLGILLIYLFSVYFGVLPSSGHRDFAFTWQHFQYLILPSVTLGLSLAAVTMRMTRSSMLEVLGQDYIRTARAKGLGERAVVLRHGLRNALIPVVTVLGIQTGALLGGTVVIEQVFSWPGLGSQLVQSIQDRDYPMVQGLTVFLAFFFVLVSLIVDIAYRYLDPRMYRRG